MVNDHPKISVLRSGVGSIAVKVAGTFLSIAMAVLLARSLGPEGYGIYAYVVALITILSIPAQFGLPNLLVRETAKAHVAAQWERMTGLWRWSAMSALGFSVILGLCAIGLALGFAERFSRLQLETFYWGLLLMPFLILGNLRGAALRGLHRVVLGQLPEQVLRPAFLVLFLLVAFLWQPVGQMASSFAMKLNAVAAIAAFLVAGWLLRRNKPEVLLRQLKPEYRSKEWLSATLPLAFTASMFLVNSYADIIMLGFFRAAADVGVYRIAATGATAVVFALTAINAVVAPQLARLHASGDRNGLQQVVTASARMGLLLAAPIFLIILFWGTELLQLLFGREFVGAYPAIITLGVGQLVNAMIGPVGVLLNMTGHERDTARAVAVSALINIPLNLLLIPRMGISGAALATALSMIVWNVIMWRTAYNRLGIESSAWHLRRGFV